jgi:uncharacterized protein
MMEIKISSEKSLKGYTLIEGFPGTGLVGPMAASYIIEKLGMEMIGYIYSDRFPPIAAVHGGVPMHTARLYADQKSKLAVVFSEFMIPVDSIYPLADELISFVRKNGISKIISIGGMPSQNPSGAAYVISSQPNLVGKSSKQGLKPVSEGVIAGVSAMLMTSAVELGIPVIDLLVEVNPELMDPKYAEVAIKGLGALTGIEIDTKELEEEAKEVNKKVGDMLKKAKESHDHYAKSAQEFGPPSYA